MFQIIFPPSESILPPSLKLIQIDLVAWELNKNIPADVAILADPKASLIELAELVREDRTAEYARAADARSQEIGQRTTATRARYAEQVQARWEDVPISGPRLMGELRDALPPNALVYAEAITIGPHLVGALQPSAPDQIVNSRGGGIGGGMPGALGAQLARPDRKVVAVCADGAAMYSLTALWTAAHHRIPVTFVMLNNGSYRILKINMREYLGDAAAARKFVGLDLNDPPLRFDLMAEAMGVPARRVANPRDLSGALRDAIAHDGPSLVDVVMDDPP